MTQTEGFRRWMIGFGLSCKPTDNDREETNVYLFLKIKQMSYIYISTNKSVRITNERILL